MEDTDEGQSLILGFEQLYRWGTRSPVLLAILLVPVSGYLESRFPGVYMKTVGSSINGVLILLLLLWTVREPQTLFGRILNWKPLAKVGILSYSLYLWQTFFLHESNAGVFWLCSLLLLELGRGEPNRVTLSCNGSSTRFVAGWEMSANGCGSSPVRDRLSGVPHSRPLA